MQRSKKKRERWTRREITERKEKDYFRATNQERFDKLKEEQRNTKESENKEGAFKNAIPADAPLGDAFAPPRTYDDFFRLVNRMHPTWSWSDQRRKATALHQRHPLIEAALLDGQSMLRDLREREKAGLGWLWPSLEALLPQERMWVIKTLKGILRKSGA